ncbi:transcriptional regulator [Photobacterium kishitanii]|uniref:histidine kinase n=1 Tax=Photobacterium kishitanii TaxID=318456 RepID=A0A0B7JAJ7_9GAMM|nr:transporter substrate-binding domain-containing protein [Photobacterium kishitanii]PSU87893.1 transcriptional regulator [Photobacterium kishitanii]PSU91551.1 transcriptional regulator [Photobacterium kishitanii]PSW69959.1 transcriptional regulator [Photobacterium kishitanii]CEO38422.1 putative composite two component regulatory protein. In SS9 not in 3TCK [Photobacterium kishitanii]
MRNIMLLLTLIFSLAIHASPTNEATTKPILTVGYTSFNWAPLAFKNNDKIIGLLPSLMDAIADKAGYQVKNIAYSSFDEMLSAFKRNEVDLLIGVASTFDRQKYMVFSDPILSTSFAMISRSPQHTKIADLNDVIVSVENGFAIEQKIKDLQIKGQILAMPSSTVALNAVETGLADVYIGNGLILQNLYTFGDFQRSLYFSPLTELPFERLYITATKNNRAIIDKINNAYNQLPESALTEIYDNWLTNTQKKMLGDPHALHLTTTETHYLQQHQNIRIGYQFPISKELNQNDITLHQLNDTLEHIKNKLHFTTTIVPIRDYQDAKQKLANNEIDIIAAIAMTKKRHRELAFTAPYGNDKWVMVDRINHRKLIGINKTDIIGVLTSGFGASLVKEHYPTAKIHQFKTKLDILHALANGEINYAVISLSAAHVLLQKNFLGQFKIVSSHIDDHNRKVSFAVKKDNLPLRDIFNKAMDSLPPSTLIDIQKKWHTVTLKADGNYHRLITFIIIFGLVISAIMGAITVWNRRLTNEIKHRKAVEDKLTYLTNNFDGVLIQHHQKSDDPMDIDILFMSEKIADFTGISASKFYFFPHLLQDRIAQREDYQNLLTAMRNAVKQGYWRTELQINTQDSTSSRWIEVRSQITPAAIGWQWNSILIDITQLKHQQLALTTAKQKSQAATTAKSRFLAMMSHEIRTPISGIICLLDLMKPYAQQPELRQIHQNLALSSENLLNIVNDVLDFSKLESKKLKLDIREKTLTKIATILVQPHAIHAAQKGLDFKLWLDPNIAQSLRFDSMRLKQVLNNLLNNAIKFTSQGSIYLDISLLSQQDNQQIIAFKVTDTGIGISPQDINKLFQPFEQIDQDSARRYDGTGLGLSICHQLIQLMGGTITVSSQLAQGTSFTIILTFDICQPTKIKPLNKHCGLLAMVDDPILVNYLAAWQCTITTLNPTTKEQLAAAVSTQCIDTLFIPQSWATEHNIDLNWIAINLPSVNWITITSANVMLTSNINARNISLSPLLPQQLYRALTQPFQPYNNDSQYQYTLPVTLTREQAIANNRYILVAEDHPINQQILKQQLEQLNYAVDIVDNGKQALIALADNHYNILLTDCHMPEMDGYELAKTIREQEQQTATIALPIIAITANALTNTERFKTMGFSDYLIKPLKQQQLKEVLAQWLQPVNVTNNVPNLTQVGTKQVTTSNISTAAIAMIDINELLPIFGDNELCQTLLQQYLASCVDDLTQLNTAIAQQNNDSIFMISHRMKGAARMMAFHQLAQATHDLELCSQQVQINTTDLQRNYLHIEQLIEQLSLQIHST